MDDAPPARSPWHWIGRGLSVTFVLGMLAWGLVAGLRARRPKGPQAFKLPTQVVMGTFVHVTVVAEEPEAALSAMRQGVARMRRVEALMSSHIESSELSQANRVARRRPAPLSPATSKVIRRGLKFAKLSAGAFDITVGPLITLWRRCAKEGRFPAPAELSDARDLVGYQRVTFSPDGRAVSYPRDGMRLDLGGIAKGYAVDAAYAEIRARGFPSALIEAGGDLYAGGVRPDGRPWAIGIQDPTVAQHEGDRVVATIPLTDKAVATSGNYRRFSVIQGERVSHILDPRTGRPADAVPSVTIVARDCTTADALATAVSVLGVAEGLRLVNATPGVEALLITVDGGKLTFHRSRGLLTAGP